MSSEGPKTVSRRPASSGRVEYGNTVVLHETTRTRITFVPFFIARSEHTELSIKLTTYRKGEPPNDWVVVEDKTLSLKESAARLLLDALRQNLVVAEEDEGGEFILLRVADGTAEIGEHEPEQVVSALVKVLAQEDIVEHLASAELSEEFTRAMRSTIRLKEMRTAVAELRTYLDSGVNDEQVYQTWCESHPWAFGSAYVVNDSVRNISASDSVDMLLPNVIAGYRDLVELKRPDMPALRYDSSHRNHYWSSDVSKAIGQCHRYLDVLHEFAANGLMDHPEIVAYHPRAIIVVGRSNDWNANWLRALHGLNHRLSSVTVMTYDQLLAQGERLLQIYGHELEPPEAAGDDWPWDEP